MLNKKLKRIGSFVASLATACIFAVANSSPSIVRAAGNDTSNAVADLPLIEISMEDANPKETIKNLVIQNRAQFDKNKSGNKIWRNYWDYRWNWKCKIGSCSVNSKTV